MLMNTQGKEGSHSQHQPEPFTLSKGKAWDGGKEERGGKGRIEGDKVEKSQWQAFFS